MTSFELQKAKKKIRQAIDGKYEQKTIATVAAAVGTRHVAINGNLASATLPDGSSGAVEVINAGRLASARYELRSGGTVSVVSGGGGGSGGGSGISFSEADTRYYTKSQLDAGQLDLRYFTETESDGRFVRLATAGTITAQHSFSPGSAAAPFTLGVNAQGQTVVGLKADQLNKSLIAGAGLLNGGALTGDVTVDVGAGTLITVNSNDVALANGTAQYQVPVTGATPFTPAYTALSAFAGNGLTFGSSFAVGVANTGAAGLSVEADAVRLTSSSAPGAAASILASDATGKLTLPLFVATSSVTTPLLTSTGTLAITSGGTSNITLDSAGDQITVKASNRISTENYASQTTGWGIDYAGGADFRYLYTDELHAKSFIADLEQALAGGQIICKSVAVLYSTFRAPAASGVTTLTVRDLPSATGMAVFQNGDMIRVRTFSRASGSLTIADCWGTVTLDTSYGTSGFDSATKTQQYTFTRSAVPNTGAMAAGTDVFTDAIILDYGTSGNGFYEVNAIDGAYAANSPYAQVAKWTGHPATGTVVNGRFGKLSGLTIGVANEMGIAVGNGFTTGDEYFKASNVGVIQNNVDSGWYNSGTKIVVINTANGIDINASGVGYDALRAYSFSDGTTFRGGVQAYLNAGETRTKLSSQSGAMSSNVEILASNSATPATAQVDITAYNAQSSKSSVISLITSSTAHEVDLSADLFAISVNKIHITNGTAADGSAAAPILSFLNDPDTGLYRAGANQLNFATGGVSRLALTSTAATFSGQVAANNGFYSSGSTGTWSTSGWAVGLKMFGQGHGIMWPKGASGASRLIGVTGSGVFYVAQSNADDSSSAATYDMTIGTSGLVSISTALISQISTTAAVPTLSLGQSDLSEEFIEFSGTVAAGNPLNTDALGTYYGRVRVSVNGTFKWLALYN